MLNNIKLIIVGIFMVNWW